MDRGLWTGAFVGFLAPLVMFSPLNNAQAWFSAWMTQPPRAAFAAQPAPRPAAAPRRLAAAPRAHKPERIAVRAPMRSHPKPVAEPVAAEVGKPLDPKEQLARTIDPAKRPDWYLIDPTLKRGDVLFLADKVVVFKGRKIGDLADYVSVSRTRMLSRKERGLIEKLAFRPTPAMAARPVLAAKPAEPNARLASAANGVSRAN